MSDPTRRTDDPRADLEPIDNWEITEEDIERAKLAFRDDAPRAYKRLLDAEPEED
jgi:hypothetical protein